MIKSIILAMAMVSTATVANTYGTTELNALIEQCKKAESVPAVKTVFNQIGYVVLVEQEAISSPLRLTIYNSKGLAEVVHYQVAEFRCLEVDRKTKN